MARPKVATPRPKKGGQGRRGGGARGRVGSAAPKTAAIHNRKKTFPGPSVSHRHHPDGRHMPEEMVGGFKCKHCGYPGWREHPVVTKEGAHHATLAFAGCTNCGTLHPMVRGAAHRANQVNAKGRVRKMAELTDDERMDVLKTVDSSETAAQRQDVETVGHRQACPRGGNAPCGADVDGRCSLCKTPVRDHQALGKTEQARLDLRKLAGLS